MSISKPARLNKVARDFNVSINTIVEFLEEKGVSVEAKPTTKIDPDMYSLLMGEFAADKEMKESLLKSLIELENKRSQFL